MAKNDSNKNRTMSRNQRKMRTYQIVFAIISLLVLASMVLSLIR